MKSVRSFGIAVFVISMFLIAPHVASAQLFRMFADRDRDDSRDFRSAEMINGAKSRLPNPVGAISANNYGAAPQVSDEVKAEVRGAIPVRSMPDFENNPNQEVNLDDVPQLSVTLRPSWSVNGTPVLPPRQRRLKTSDATPIVTETVVSTDVSSSKNEEAVPFLIDALDIPPLVEAKNSADSPETTQ